MKPAPITSPTAPPRWTFAVATVIWAVIVGFATRIVFAIGVAPIAGKAVMRWLSGTPLGLATCAAIIQFALFGMVQMRSRVMPDLRVSLLRSMRRRPSRWLTSTLLILGTAPLANFCGIWLAHLTGTPLDAMEYVNGLVRHATVFELCVLALALTLLPAIVEESIFRGLVLGSLDELRPGYALAISAAAFGAFHLDLAQGVATAILGIGFGYIALQTGSILGSMISHGLYNLFVLMTQRLLTSDSATPVKWQLLQVGAGLVVAVAAGLRLYQLRFVACVGADA